MHVSDCAYTFNPSNVETNTKNCFNNKKQCLYFERGRRDLFLHKSIQRHAA